MSWIARDPPSPLVDTSPKLKDELPKPEGNTLAPSPIPESDPLPNLFEPESNRSPALRAAWGGGSILTYWLLPAVQSTKKSSPEGFRPGTISIRVSFRRGDYVFAAKQNMVLKAQNTISFGSCDIPLSLDEPFIDVDITVFFNQVQWKTVKKMSAPMTRAIRASLDGDFPADVTFMLFSRKSGGTSVCGRRPIYASSIILKGRNLFLDSYMDISRGSDNPPSPDVYQCPYDEDSDLESDVDEDPSPTWSELGLKRFHNIGVCASDQGESPVCSVQADESMGRLQALIIYMYTKEVAFIQLKSSGGRSYSFGDSCSPESMYRLAGKASHEGPKKHAFDNLRSQITPQNIITEIFSKFTAEYAINLARLSISFAERSPFQLP
ncbi:hypothetical protein IW261DRAFT_1592496 [Armillaria novae-zelandiae]|uniref:Uncharacterized protein n=1 Tax=Armillaria novae-zelandiae TaxID=153914 RepID=A0AA39PBP1_9AGAR|nr:hypothetical protein IW261DRAFT_1592496 [Armillaria novae-zelandiae]